MFAVSAEDTFGKFRKYEFLVYCLFVMEIIWIRHASLASKGNIIEHNCKLRSSTTADSTTTQKKGQKISERKQRIWTEMCVS
jgi:hypothetical protein